MKRKIIYLILILTLGFILIGCSSNNDQDPVVDNDDPVVENPKEDELNRQELEAVYAYDLYLDKYPNTEVYKFSLDSDNNEYYYKIKGVDDDNKYEYKIAYANSEIIEEKEKVRDDNDSKESIVREDIEKAYSIVSKALEDAGNTAYLDEWTVEVEDGRVIVEVEIDYEDKDDTEITYDVESGEIIKEDD